jgi:Secretion system C-terminal sorting domain
MKKNKYLYLIYLWLPFGLSAQYFDANWPVGILEYPNEDGYGNAILHFDSSGSSWQMANLNMNFERTVAAISDSTGQLICYTNGCQILGADGDTLLNGEGINPGPVHELLCEHTGYNVPKGAMFIPFPGHPNQYFLFHLGQRYTATEGYSTGPFYYSIINFESGYGTVTAKNTIIFDANPESFTAIRHGNGRDWWIICAERKSNWFHRWLLSPEGLSNMGSQAVGAFAQCSRPGILAAAPSGDRIARTHSCQIGVLNFERCSGNLSHQVTFQQSSTRVNGGGASFSNDGNTLIYNGHLAIMAADLTSPTPILDTIIPLVDSLFGIGLYLSERGPNGTIYFSRPHRSQTAPTLSGIDQQNIEFVAEGFTSPVITVRSLPHFPNYRLYDKPNASCDTLGINTPTNTSIVKHQPVSMEVFPNPSSDFFHLNYLGQKAIVSLTVYDLQGKIIYKLLHPNANQTIQAGHWPAGHYVLVMQDEKGYVFSKVLEKI